MSRHRESCRLLSISDYLHARQVVVALVQRCRWGQQALSALPLELSHHIEPGSLRIGFGAQHGLEGQRHLL